MNSKPLGTLLLSILSTYDSNVSDCLNDYAYIDTFIFLDLLSSFIFSTDWFTALWKFLISRVLVGSSLVTCGEKVWRIGVRAVFLGEPMRPKSSIERG